MMTGVIGRHCWGKQGLFVLGQRCWPLPCVASDVIGLVAEPSLRKTRDLN